MWSDDGKTIYAITAEEGRANLKRFDAATGKVAPWTSGNHDIQSYSIHGGKTVALIATPTIINDLSLRISGTSFSTTTRATISKT